MALLFRRAIAAEEWLIFDRFGGSTFAPELHTFFIALPALIVWWNHWASLVLFAIYPVYRST